MKCPACGSVNSDENLFCEECGEKLELPKPTCPQCGKDQNKANPKFCPFCGFRFATRPVLGDKNVVVGDVLNNSHNIIHNTTIYQNIVSTHEVALACPACGKLNENDSTKMFRCKECGESVCIDCYDRSAKLCVRCANEKKKPIRPELSIFDYEELSNGKVALTNLKDKEILSITIPSYVESVGPSCFEGSKIVSATISEGVVALGNRAFADCKSLVDVTFPKSLKIIGDAAFLNCYELDVDKPAKCKIGKDAFKGSVKERKEAETKAKAKRLDAELAEGGLDISCSPALRLKMEKALDGDCEAQFELAIEYANSDWLPKDKRKIKCLFWYEKASEQGHVYAPFHLGQIYMEGKIVPPSAKEALKWYRLSAERGNAYAQCELGLFYEKGDVVPQSFEEAIKWYQMAAEQDSSTGKNRLDHLYRDGKGAPSSAKDAFEWYENAAKKGYSGAQYRLGLCYEEGTGVAKSLENALKWFQKAAKGKEHLAKDKLVWHFEHGKGGPSVAKTVIKFYEEDAKKGYSDAQYKLAVCYEKGNVVPQSYERAVELYFQAATRENARAQYDLGRCFEEGKGLSKSMTEAMKWYKKAAGHGHKQAKQKVGMK